MKRKTSILGLIAGLLLAGPLLGQSALAQFNGDDTDNNSTTVTVDIASGGIFDAFFCTQTDPADPTTVIPSDDASLTVDTAPTSSVAGVATGAVGICYDDTKTYRPSFDTTISSLDFTSGLNTIPSSNFKITQTYGVGQVQCSNHPICGAVAGTGDIGAYQNEDYVDQTTGPWPWTFDQSLNEDRLVQFGYSGIGTIFSGGRVDVSLDLPIGTHPGTYESTLSLSIVLGSQP